MEAYHEQNPIVKPKITGFLKINHNGQAEVEFNSQKVVLDDTPYSRWWLKVNLAHLNSTEDARKWYLQFPPKLPPIKGLLIKPWNHQELAIYRMLLSNTAEFLDMGCGKTLTALALCLCLYENNQNYFLCVAPPTVFVTWLDEIASKIDPALNSKVYVLHGVHKAKRLADLRSNTEKCPKFILTTYETLESVRPALQTLPIAAVFFDESSKVKNITAKRTKSCHALVNAIPGMRRYCLSGTPSTKNCLGLFSQLELLGPCFSGHHTFTSFEKKYAVSKLFAMIRLPHGKITSVDADDAADSFPRWLATHYPPGSTQSYASLGYSLSQSPGPNRIKILNYHRRNIRFINQDELNATVNRHAYTVFKDEIFDLPPKTYTKRVLEMSDEQRKAYSELLETNRTVLLSTPFSFRSSAHMKLHQVAQGFLTHADGSVHFLKTQPKLNELEQLLDEVGKQKILIWSPFRPQIAQIVTFIKNELETPVLELHGDIAIEKRRDLVHQFSDVNGPQILVANPEVGGMGLNLTCASVEVFFANWYKSDTRKQAEDRCWRPGQTRGVTIIDFVTAGTIEVEILRKTLKEIELERTLLSMNALKGG